MRKGDGAKTTTAPMESHSAATTTTAAKVSRIIGSSSNRKVSGGGSVSEETSADANSGSEMTRFETGRHQHHHPHSNTAMKQMRSSSLGHHRRSPIQRLCNSSPVCRPRFTSRSGAVATKLFHAAAVLCLLFVFSSDLVGNQVLPRVAAGSVSGGFSLNSTQFGSSGIVDDAPGNESQRRSGGHYTPMWAVDIPGGIEVADDVARHHGFINHGRVSATAINSANDIQIRLVAVVVDHR